MLDVEDEEPAPSTGIDRAIASRWPLVLLLTLGGAAIRVVVARQDLFADELATYWIVAHHGLRDVLRIVASTAEISPPLSFVLSWLTGHLGLTPELIRLPGLLAGIATVPLVYALGLRTVGPRAALLATALTTLSPFMILYSAEARGYGLLMALVVGSTLALLRALEQGRIAWWVVYALCTCLAMYTHYTTIFVLLAQVLWAAWRHPTSRRPLVLANVAAVVLYLPWVPSLRGDLDSPTTTILSALSPMSLGYVRETLGHWSVGYSYTFPATDLGTLPGVVPLLMVAAAVVLGLVGLARGERAPGGAHTGLVVLLAAATPVGTIAQSAIGTNVLSIRNLAASWPYLALAAACVIASSGRRTWAVSAALAVGAFAVATVTLLGPDFRRPSYGPIARFADEHHAAVVIDAVGWSPGPLTNLDVDGTHPDAPLLRLRVPAQRDRPFDGRDQLPDEVAVFAQAAEIADGRPIVVAVYSLESVAPLIATLPKGYEVTDRYDGTGVYFFDPHAVVLEKK